VLVALGGSMVAVELISRFLGARSAAVARTGTLVGGVMYLALGTLPVFLGLAATHLATSDPTLKAEIGNAEQLVAVLAARYLPQWAYIVFAGAIVSAILSVVHAALHAPAAQVSHNLVERTAVRMSARARLWSVRLTVMALSIVAYGLALSSSRIKELVEIASAFGSAGVVVTTLFAVFTRKGGPASAAASILSGLAVWSLGRFALDWTAPYMTALAASTTVYLAVATFEETAHTT
jgi:Na+/proline symporter